MNFQDPIASFLGPWSSGIDFASIIFRIALSIVLSAVIGTERAAKRHSAGLRTFMTISVFFTAAMIIDLALGSELYLLSAASILATSFLSSNTLLFSSRSRLQGFTTAIALFSAGIIGLSAGAGLYALTLVSFFALYAILHFLPAVEDKLWEKSRHFMVHLELKNSLLLQDFVFTIRRLGLRIDDLEPNTAYLNSGLAVYSVSISITDSSKEYRDHSEILKALRTLDFISYIEEMEK